jgi:hypothetical protein
MKDHLLCRWRAISAQRLAAMKNKGLKEKIHPRRAWH